MAHRTCPLSNRSPSGRCLGHTSPSPPITQGASLLERAGLLTATFFALLLATASSWLLFRCRATDAWPARQMAGSATRWIAMVIDTRDTPIQPSLITSQHGDGASDPVLAQSCSGHRRMRVGMPMSRDASSTLAGCPACVAERSLVVLLLHEAL